METKKIASLFVILMFSFSAFGFAYAHWYDYLYVDITANTGYVDADLTWAIYLPDTNMKPVYGEVCTVTCQGYDDDLRNGYDSVDLIFENVYPCLTVILVFDIHCVGTIPIAIQDFTCYEFSGVVDADVVGQGWYSPDDATPEQIDPCQTLYFWMIYHVNNPTLQSNTDHIGFDVEVVNWNELVGSSPSFGPYGMPNTAGFYLTCSHP